MNGTEEDGVRNRGCDMWHVCGISTEAVSLETRGGKFFL